MQLAWRRCHPAFSGLSRRYGCPQDVLGPARRPGPAAGRILAGSCYFYDNIYNEPGACQADFTAQHAKVPVINLGTPDNQGSRHYGSNVAGTAQIVRWFLRLSR